MQLDPIKLAIPFYFLLIAIELVVSHFQNIKRYRFNDTITNINSGSSMMIATTLMRVVGISLYTYIYEHFALFNIPSTWFFLILCFIVDDFCYYWGHRMTHEVNVAWSSHVVHHHSEEMNFSVALRQSWFQGVWTAPVYIPMALMGFNPMDVVIAHGFNLLYQYWVHTEMIDKLGFLELFMVTPSHHRVHHGRNPKYIDKNHAGVFIIWDKMFGTFQAEEERPVYGTTKPLNSWNPIWANFEHFESINHQLKDANGFWSKMKVLFKKPGWDAKAAAYMPFPEVERGVTPKFDTETPQYLNLYIFFQYLITTAFIIYFLFNSNKMNWVDTFTLGGIILFQFATAGGMLEGKKAYFVLEFVRNALFAIILSDFFMRQGFDMMWVYGVIFSSIISFVWLIALKGVFQIRMNRILNQNE
jgi:alkylglycerol monooxygenase